MHAGCPARGVHRVGSMDTTAVTLIEITLEDPGREAELMAWWDEARRLLADRARLSHADLHVVARGQYQAELGFALPGGWGVMSQDRRWKVLEARRPPARVHERTARRWRRDGNPRDVTTAELQAWLTEREAGRRDFVLVDTLPRESWEDKHLPGAISLPLTEMRHEQAVTAALGTDKDRTIVVYCSSYG